MGNINGSNKNWTVDHSLDDPPPTDFDHELGSRNSSISTISGGSKEPAYANNPTKLVETEAQRKARRKSHWVAYATMFVMTMGFSIVLSGVWPYLKNLIGTEDKSLLGPVVAANPLGQMIASPLMGMWGNKTGSIRIQCYTTMTLFILGNIFYANLYLFTDLWNNSAYHCMILSRFIVGLSSSNATLCRSYLASSTTLQERTTGITIVSAAQSLGFVIGPTLQTILALIISDPVVEKPNFVLDKYTACGWVAAGFGIINFILLTPIVFQEFNIAEKERAMLKDKSGGEHKKILPKPDYIGIGGIMYGFFMVQFVYVLLETLMEPFVTDQYGLSDDTAIIYVGIAFVIAGVLAVIMFVTATRLAKIYDERKIMIFIGVIPIVIGTALFLPWGGQKLTRCPETNITENSHLAMFDYDFLELKHSPVVIHQDSSSENTGGPMAYILDLIENLKSKLNTYERSNGKVEECFGCPYEQEWCDDIPRLPVAQFCVAYIIVILGYPFGVSMSNSLFSKMLGSKPQGVWMGLLTACGSLSRIIGPIFVSYLYYNKGTRLTFIIILAGMLIALTELLINYKRFVPLKEDVVLK